jgi:hypothetical protein
VLVITDLVEQLSCSGILDKDVNTLGLLLGLEKL